MSKFEKYKKDKNPNYFQKKMNNLLLKLKEISFLQSKAISMAIVECFSNISFHAFDTFKVRIQARSIFDDNSLFFKNKVNEKSKINNLFLSFYIWYSFGRNRIIFIGVFLCTNK